MNGPRRTISRAGGAAPRGRHGYSLVEVMICVVIVGGMFAAAVHTLGAVRLGERQTSDRTGAHVLAQALLDELSRKPYDQIMDYDGWSASPPTRLDGTPLEGVDDWTCQIHVMNVQANAVNDTTASDTGLMRITVRVQRGEVVLAEVAALRGRGLQKERPTGAIAP